MWLSAGRCHSSKHQLVGGVLARLVGCGFVDFSGSGSSRPHGPSLRRITSRRRASLSAGRRRAMRSRVSSASRRVLRDRPSRMSRAAAMVKPISSLIVRRWSGVRAISSMIWRSRRRNKSSAGSQADSGARADFRRKSAAHQATPPAPASRPMMRPKKNSPQPRRVAAGWTTACSVLTVGREVGRTACFFQSATANKQLC